MKIKSIFIELLCLITIPFFSQMCFASENVGSKTKRYFIVDQNHPAATDQGPGNRLTPFKSISQAGKLAGPGDTVLVYQGVYRERVAPATGGLPDSPIVYMAAPGNTVVIKGSEIWKPEWKVMEEEKRLYSGVLDPTLFEDLRINPYRTPLKAAPDEKNLTLGQVFVDGEIYHEVDNLNDLKKKNASWMVIEDGKEIAIHFPASVKNPKDHMIEITVRDRIFAPHKRGLGHIHVCGFVMEHCANQFPASFWNSDSPQAGALGCRAGHHWVIEKNIIRYAKSLGIDCGYEGRHDLEGDQPTPENTGYHLIRNNHIAFNGVCGIAGIRSTGTRMIGNVIEHNNLNHHTSPEVGGIKVHFFVDGLIEGNLVIDNESHGIWLDNVYRNARVTRNVILNNRAEGIFVELGYGPVLIDNNIIANSRPSFYKPDPRGDGIYTHDASGVNFVHNLVFGCRHFGAFHRKVTDRRKAGVSNIKLMNNIFIDNGEGNINLPYPGPHAQGNFSDYNIMDDNGVFVINHWGGAQTKEMVEAVEKNTDTNPHLWHDRDPILNIKQWQSVMQWGKHSIATASIEAYVNEQYQLTLTVDESFLRQYTKVYKGIDADFQGIPIPSEGVLPGPFQSLREGRNTIKLW